MTIVQMSLVASALILFIAVIRGLTKNKLPKATFLILWGIALYRLLIPFSVPSSLSPHTTVYEPRIPTEGQLMDMIVSNTATMAAGAAQATAGSRSWENPLQHVNILPSIPSFMWVWLTGTILMAAIFLATHVRWRSEYRTSLPADDPFLGQWLKDHPIRRTIQLRQSDQITSPLTYGIWRPVILLPKAMDYTDKRQLDYVLTHELIHIKRFDTLTKWLLAAALCIHWFNPFVWVMYILANRDMEMSCDEAVVRKIGLAEKSAYALTLIHMEETRSKWTPLFTNFSKNPMEERITAIMKIKKTNLIGVTIALALVAGTTIAFATNAVEDKTLGLFEQVLGDDKSEYADYINEAAGESTTISTQEHTLTLNSTIFTDHNVYAILEVEGELTGEFDLSGRIAYPNVDQTAFGLNGEFKEIEPGDGVRYFLYSASIAEPPAPKNANEQLILAAGDQFLKHNSLRDFEGTLLEITANLNGKEHFLTAPVENVSTKALIFHPDAANYERDYFDTLVLTPYEVKLTGISNQDHVSDALWEGPPIKLTIVLDDKTEINMSYDTRGTVSDEGYPVGHSRGRGDDGKIYHYWNFRMWELDLSQVTAFILDGVTYRVDR